MQDHPFKLPLYPFSNYFAFAMLILIVIFMFINPDTRISVIAGALVLIVATIVYLVRHKSEFMVFHYPTYKIYGMLEEMFFER